MVRVVFPEPLRPCVPRLPVFFVVGANVADALADVFRQIPTIRSYLFDDRGVLRPRMEVFVNGHAIRDRLGLSDSIDAGAEVCVVPFQND
jgi:sulfur-carrier protein